MSFVRALRLFSYLAAAVAALPATAAASPITFHFTVEVTSLTGTAAAAFTGLTAGDVVSGTYTFESAAPDANAAPLFGRFDFTAPAGLAAATLDIEGKTIGWKGTRIDTFNGGVDFYRVQNAGNDLIADPVIGAASFLANLVGPATALPSTALPLTPLDVSLFTTSSSFSMFVETQAGDGEIFGNVTSITAEAGPTAVPEPASLLLLGTSVSALIARRRKHRNR